MRIDLNPAILYSDDFISIETDEQVSFFYLEWLQSPDTETFRRLFMLAVDTAIEKGYQYWLSDARSIPFLDFSDQNWVLREIAPKMLSSSLKRYARLTTKQGMGMLDIHRIASNLPEGADTQLENFTNKDAALEWLFTDYTFNSLQE